MLFPPHFLRSASCHAHLRKGNASQKVKSIVSSLITTSCSCCQAPRLIFSSKVTVLSRQHTCKLLLRRSPFRPDIEAKSPCSATTFRPTMVSGALLKMRLCTTPSTLSSSHPVRVLCQKTLYFRLRYRAPSNNISRRGRQRRCGCGQASSGAWHSRCVSSPR